MTSEVRNWALLILLTACTSASDGETTEGSGSVVAEDGSVANNGGTDVDGAAPATGGSGNSAGSASGAAQSSCALPSDACDVVAQTGCDSGSSCYPVRPLGGDPAPACASTGSAALGSACTREADCAAGLTCVRGSCATLCCPDSNDGCEGKAVCDPLLLTGGVQAAFGSCYAYSVCDPARQVGCAAGQTCKVESFDTNTVSCQIAAGTKAIGEACQDGECAAGLQCIKLPELGEACRQVCRGPARDVCPENHSCVSAGEGQLGLCVPN